MSKILLTGGAGFIGSHIADAYVEAGHKVVVVDDLSVGKKENINKKVKFYKADLRNKRQIKKIFAQEKPEIKNVFLPQLVVLFTAIQKSFLPRKTNYLFRLRPMALLSFVVKIICVFTLLVQILSPLCCVTPMFMVPDKILLARRE